MTSTDWLRQSQNLATQFAVSSDIRIWPGGDMQDLEMATLGGVDWFNNRRLFGLIGNIPPAEAEESFYAQGDVLDMVA
jgi:hypothetical protein